MEIIISYSNKVLLLNEEQLKNFLTVAVINNKDITNFTMIDLDKIDNTPLSNILNITGKVCSPIIVADLYCNNNFKAIKSILTAAAICG